MNIRKKGAGIAFTSTLLAALVATVAAPLAFAAVAVTGVGTVPNGGTSTGTATFVFTENSAACFNTGGDTNALRVTIRDSANQNRVHFSGTPVVTAPGSLGATAGLSNNGTSSNRLDVSYAGADNSNVEQITVTGLKISADSNAATGAIIATLSGSSANCVVGPTGTATGTLSVGVPIGAGNDPAVVLTGNCSFQATGGLNGNASINGDSRAVTAVAAPINDATDPHPGPGDTQSVTFAAGSSGHVPGETVTQTVNISNCNTTISSPGSVAAALTTSTSGATQVNPGEFTQAAGTVVVSEAPNSPADTLNGESLTFTITGPATGVVFSAAPTVTYTGGATGPATCSLSVDRHTCTVSGVSNAGASGTVVIHPNLDVDSSVALGTPVVVTVAASPAIAINSNGVTIAYVGRVIVGSGAQPTIYIGFNDQATGIITFTEQGPGFFIAGLGGNNTFAICPETGEVFTRAPWAVVTSGDLKFLNGVVGASQVKGTLAPSTVAPFEICAYWTVYSASTVASTIEIRGSADDSTPLGTAAASTGTSLSTDGPRVNVPKSGFGATPGSTQFELLVGTQAQVLSNTGFSQVVSNAIRAFKNNISATAASQPNIPQGSADALGGNIVVTETQNGQFKPGDLVTVRILPRSTTQRQDVILKTGNTNDLPIVTANTATTGFAVTPVGVNCPPSAILGVVVCQFSFTVTQQAFGPGLASFTISNIHYITAADAVNGPVLVEITNTPGAGQPLDVVVTNANIGNGPTPPATTKTQAASAVTKTNTASAFTVSTKVVHLVASSNNIVTIRIKVDPALVGKSVIIQRATKNSAGVWSAFTNLTTRVVGSDGYAYYYASAHSAQWNSYRGMFPGNAQWAPSTSQTVQVRWI